MLYLILSSNINAKSNKIIYDPTRSYINYSSTMVSSHTIHDDRHFIHKINPGPKTLHTVDGHFIWRSSVGTIQSHFAISGFPTKFETLLGIIHQHLPLFLLQYKPAYIVGFFFFRENPDLKHNAPFPASFRYETRGGRLGIPRLGNPRWIVTQLFRFDGNRSRPRGWGSLQPTAFGSREFLLVDLEMPKVEACVF